jgi:hypothetical protein
LTCPLLEQAPMHSSHECYRAATVLVFQTENFIAVGRFHLSISSAMSINLLEILEVD